MNPADRIRDWIESLSESWKDRLRGWVLRSIAEGAKKFLEDEEPAARDNVKDMLIRIRDNPNTPPDIKALAERALEPHSWIQIVVLIIMGVVMLVQTVGTLVPPALRRMEQAEERVAQTYRLDPISLITAWRRDKPAYEQYFDDLRDQGWSDDRIEALKFFTLFMPSAQDLVNWQAKEVFEPAMIAKYGLDDEFEALDLTMFDKIGVTREQALNYWRAHWEHPELRTIIEMLRRTDFTEDDMKAWFRLVEIPPFWRDKLIEISYEVPTRVDVRRWWDMRTIDEARLREIYAWQGYHGKDLDDYVLWTKVYVAFPDLIARWKNGWITIDEVRAELTGYGMPAVRVEELLETKFKNTEADRTASERDITKTDIIKGVKKGVITRGEGMELLMDLGYDEDEADYILTINIPIDEEDVVISQRELTKSDIKSAVKIQLITPDDAVSRLVALRYTQADAEFLSSIYASLIPIERVETQRALTKSDIAKALRKGILNASEAHSMLLDLRYSETDAAFLVETNMPPPPLVEEEKLKELAKTDIKSALKVGIITPESALNRLEAITYTHDDAEFLVEIYTTVMDLSKITKPREASKADIVLAVKKGLITPEEGYLMLQEIGFTPEAAQFILSVRAEVSPFSPVSYQEFKDNTGKWRKAAGMASEKITEKIRQAATEVVKLTKDLKTLQTMVREEEAKLIKEEGLPAEATARRDELRVALHRAEATLAEAQAHYDALVAEWRHKA